jgi:threonine/homoserine/homoserine lactone efflux protein
MHWQLPKLHSIVDVVGIPNKMVSIPMLDTHSWMLFLSAACVLAFAPGPGMMYVLSRTLAGGTAAGVASTLGTCVGGFVHVLAAAFGISVILATSAIAFTVVKWCGALFLVYLGVKLLISARRSAVDSLPILTATRVQFRNAFFQGILAEVLNPKTAVFFLAFVPQFIRPANGGVFGQFLILGTIVVTLNTLPDFLIAIFAGPVSRLWNKSKQFRSFQQAASGVCLIGLGAYLGLSGSGSSITASSPVAVR